MVLFRALVLPEMGPLLELEALVSDSFQPVYASVAGGLAATHAATAVDVV